MSQADHAGGAGGAGEAEEAVLQAKYLDFCSARMAELLLRLSADEMYLLAEDAARESDVGDARELSYDTIVRLATERLSRRIALPPFETWVIAYREDPALFDRELIGLWKSELGATRAGSTRQG